MQVGGLMNKLMIRLLFQDIQYMIENGLITVNVQDTTQSQEAIRS